MIKKLFFLFLFILSSLVIPSSIQAKGETNKFGIHILEPSEIKQAATLVNSQGGDWGFVTIVIRDNDMDYSRWQQFFNDCRRLHLVPLVRLATHIENNHWVKPNIEDANKWAKFLNSLNWPIKNQYVIIFNEPNHAKEWGGEINPQEYAHILKNFIAKLKAENANFKILNAGFDLAAPNSKSTMDTRLFWQKMNQEIPGIFNQLDGWASHSYPNHGFIGRPTDQGRISIRGYQWEIYTLKKYFQLTKNLPVFITETGWPHRHPQLKPKDAKYYDPETVAKYIEAAYKSVWLPDKNVVAITPFTLNYHTPPLDNFSWLDNEGRPFPQYERIKNLPKKSWWPEQETHWQIKNIKIPRFLPVNSQYEGKIVLQNTGQSIWGEKEFLIKPLSSSTPWIKLPPQKLVFPGEEYAFSFTLTTPFTPQTYSLSWQGIGEFSLTVFNPASLKSYQSHFLAKILSLIKVWWYDRINQKLKCRT